MDPQAQLLAFFSLSISLLEILIIGIILKNYEEGFVKFMILTKILNSCNY